MYPTRQNLQRRNGPPGNGQSTDDAFIHGYREFHNEIRVKIINDCWIGAQVNSEWRRPHVPKVERIDLEENSMYRISLDRV